MNAEYVVVLNDVRSMHNVGAIIRSCNVFGVSRLVCCGITPYPRIAGDTRLPHIAARADSQITKTSLGAEKSLSITHAEDIHTQIDQLQKDGFAVVAIEQSPSSIPLQKWQPNPKIALVFGNEVDGVSSSVLAQVNAAVEIQQFGDKESLNVAASAAIALHHLATKA